MKTTRIIVIGLVCLVWASLAQAATYYVGTAGSDANSCATAQTIGTPKLTISAGKDCLTTPGDTLIVRNGTYVQGNISMNASGTAGNYITMQAENLLGAIISSTSTNQCQPAIYANGSYTHIDGFDFRVQAGSNWCTADSTAGDAIRAFNGPVGLWVSRIKVDDPLDAQGRHYRSHSVKSNQSNTIIEDSELNAGLETLGADDTSIRRNRIGCCGGNWGNGIVTKGGGHDVWVYDNVIDAPTMPGIGIILGGANASESPPQECWNCVAWNNVVRVPASSQALDFQGCKDCVFVNNVTVGGSIGMAPAPSSTNINNRWYNNILSCNGGPALGGLLGTNTIDYNDFFNCSGTPVQAHPITGNPQFVNTTNLADLHLLAGSVAIGSGTIPTVPSFSGANASIVTAKDGTLRVTPWDLGLYDGGTAGADTIAPSVPSGLTVSP